MLKTVALARVVDVIRALGAGPATRFGALRHVLGGGVSAWVLSVQLKEPEAMSLVRRMDAGTVPMHVQYSLTSAGSRLDAALRQSAASFADLGLIGLFAGRPEVGVS